MHTKRLLIAINVLLIGILSCNLSAAQGTGTPDLAATITAQAQTLQAPTGTPSLPSATPTITPTFTPSVPQVSVSSPTNCRTGQGANFDFVFAMNPRQTADVVGKDTPDNYWIIKNLAGGTCWLWGQYATVTGNVSAIPDVAPLPTPTPSIPAAPKDFNVDFTCTFVATPIHNAVHADLSWADVATNEEGYRIFRTDVLLATLGANVTSFEDDTPLPLAAAVIPPLPPPSVKCGIRAFNGAGTSATKEVNLDCG